jgi:protein gp37
MGQAHRFSGAGKPYEGLTTIRRGKVDWAGMARLVPEQLAAPLSWRKPARIFVNSMSDLFHESLSNEDIASVFGVMAACPQHTFQVLTKRPKRMAEWFKWIAAQGRLLPHLVGERVPAASSGEGATCVALADQAIHPYVAADDELWTESINQRVKFMRHAETAPWPLPQVWVGVSVENQEQADKRIPLLLETPAAVRFISAEPLLGPINFEHIGNALFDRAAAIRKAMNGPAAMNREQAEADIAHPQLDWVIVGGESSNGARPCDIDWIRSIVEQCKAAGVAAFVKQLGSRSFSWDESEPTGRFRTDPETGKRQLEVVTRRLADKKGGDPAEWPGDLRVREFPKRTEGDR